MGVPTTFDVDERNAGQYTCTLVKEDGSTPIPSAQLTILTLTLYSIHSGAIINGRDTQNVLNLNGVTVDSAGLLTWTVEQADTAILDATLTHETHVALFQFTYQSGAKGGNHEVKMRVRNLTKVT